MKVEQLKTIEQVNNMLLEAALTKGFRSFKGSRDYGEALLAERLIYTVRDVKVLQAVALVSEESYHLPGHMGIGLIDFSEAAANRETAIGIIHRIFSEAKSLGKGVRNTLMDPHEYWLNPIFESVSKQFPTVIFVQAQ